MDIHELLKQSASLGASDLHITVGLPPISRIHGHLQKLTDEKLSPQITESFIKSLLNQNQWNLLQEKGEVDFSVSVFGLYRYRVNAYKQRGSYAAAMRLVESNILGFEQLGLPPILSDLCNRNR